MKTIIEIDVKGPVEAEVYEIVEAIATEMATQYGNDSGTLTTFGGEIDWHVIEEGQGVEIDRRQRVAAANLLVAFDLPQEMHAAAQSILEASRVCPGIKADEISMNLRKDALHHARRLIVEMLAEIS